MEKILTGIRRMVAVGVLLAGLSLVFKAVGWGLEDFEGQLWHMDAYGKFDYDDMASGIFNFGMAAVMLGFSLLGSLTLWFVDPFDN